MGMYTSQFQHWASQFQHWASDYSGPNIYMNQSYICNKVSNLLTSVTVMPSSFPS